MKENRMIISKDISPAELRQLIRKGQWNKPDLVYAPIENLKGLGNLLKRALLTPVRIIKKISNAAKNMKKTEDEVTDDAESKENKGPEEIKKP